MKISFIVIGAVLLIVAIRGTQQVTPSGGKGLWPLVKADFEPGAKGNFLAWGFSIAAIGAVGYVPELRGISDAMLALVILVLLLANKGFYAQLKTALTTPQSGATNAGA